MGRKNKTPNKMKFFQCNSSFFVCVRSIKKSNAKKNSLFELNEKVLKSSFKMNFAVRTARVFELIEHLPYMHITEIVTTLSGSLQASLTQIR